MLHRLAKYVHNALGVYIPEWLKLYAKSGTHTESPFKRMIFRYLLGVLDDAFDVATSFIYAREDAVEAIAELFSDSPGFAEVRSHAHRDIAHATTLLNELKRRWPEVRYTVFFIFNIVV